MSSLAKIVIHEVAVTGLQRDPGVRRDMQRRGDRVLDQAQNDAPVLSGEYRDGLHLEEIEDGGVRIAGSTDHDIYVEADTGNLARSLDAAGGS